MKTSRTYITLLLSIVFFCTSALGTSIQITKPERVGFSSERLQRIDGAMQEFVTGGDAAGVTVLVARRGKVVYFETFGMRDIENQKPMMADTIFRIYSMSKPITSAALMTLYEEGKFFLNDPVEKYLPEFKDLEVFQSGTVEKYWTVERKSPVTILQLLTHTSGLPYGLSKEHVSDKLVNERKLFDIGIPLKDKIPVLASIPLKFQPGERWEYSYSVDVQGRLIEVLSGMPFDRFLQERIFEPLNMDDTSFIVSKEKRDRFAQLYAYNKDKTGLEPGEIWGTFDEQMKFFSGGGGLTATTGDYYRFAQMLLNGGELDGKRILGRKTVDLMRTDHLTDEQRANSSYKSGFGLGVSVQLTESRTDLGSIGNFGWGGAAGTHFWIDPKEDLIGLFMVQHTSLKTRIHRQFQNLVYQALVD